MEVRLRATQALLLALIAALGLIGKRIDYWPVVTWPVYASVRPQLPGPTASLLEARVRTRDGGDPHVLRSADLVERSRHRLADEALARAASPDATAAERAFLARLAGHALPAAELEAIEVWELTFAVDVAVRPPLDLDRPARERLRAAFPVVPGARP